MRATWLRSVRMLYGPRYLHSTGQLHKGGPATGRFLLLVHDSEPDIPVPGAPYTFNRLKHAQATGDFEALRSRGRPTAWLTLRGDEPAAALRGLTDRLLTLL
jgi:hypothetical protein